MSKRAAILCLLFLCGLAAGSLAITPGDGVVYGAPPRPTLAPLPTPPPLAPGGFIELRLVPLQENLWTRVQWRGVGDVWHDVEGWQGAPDETGRVRWYVGPEILGRGPFRWLAADGPDGPLLGVSEPFHLPALARQVVVVAVELPAGRE